MSYFVNLILNREGKIISYRQLPEVKGQVASMQDCNQLFSALPQKWIKEKIRLESSPGKLTCYKNRITEKKIELKIIKNQKGPYTLVLKEIELIKVCVFLILF